MTATRTKGKTYKNPAPTSGVPRVSQRAPRSCSACAKRKIKCDKVIPCQPCKDRDEAHLCAREVVVVKGEVRNLDAKSPPKLTNPPHHDPPVVYQSKTVRSDQTFLSQSNVLPPNPLLQVPLSTTLNQSHPQDQTHLDFSHHQPWTQSSSIKTPSSPVNLINNPPKQQTVSQHASPSSVEDSDSSLKVVLLEREKSELMNQVAKLQQQLDSLNLASISGSPQSVSGTHNTFSINPYPNTTTPSASNYPNGVPLSSPPPANSPFPTFQTPDVIPSPGFPISVDASVNVSAAAAENNRYADALQVYTMGVAKKSSSTTNSASLNSNIQHSSKTSKKHIPKHINIELTDTDDTSQEISSVLSPTKKKPRGDVGSCCGNGCDSHSSHHTSSSKKDAFRTIIPALSRKPVALKDTQLSCPSCSVGEMSHCFAARLPFSDESQVSKIMYSLAYDLPPITYQMSTTLVSHTLEHLNFLSSAIHPPSFYLEHDYFWSKIEGGTDAVIIQNKSNSSSSSQGLNQSFDKNRGQYLWLAQWYAVLCLGCFFADRKLGREAGLTPQLQKVLPHKLFAASFECLHRGEIFKCPDIRALQVLAVLGPCFQAFGAINMRNSYLSIAIYVAQRLNITKLEDESVLELFLRQDAGDPDSTTRILDREMGRRIWWATVITDWNDNTGRNSLIQPSSFSTVMPANLDDQDLLNLSEVFDRDISSSNVDATKTELLSTLHSKPLTTYTSVSFQLVMSRLAQLKRSCFASLGHQALANLEFANQEIEKIRFSIPDVLRADYVPHTHDIIHNPHFYTQCFQRYLVQMAIEFEKLTVNRNMAVYMPQTEWNSSCRKACLKSAQSILAAAAAPASSYVLFEFKRHPSVTGNGVAAAIYVLLDLLDLGNRQRIELKEYYDQKFGKKDIYYDTFENFSSLPSHSGSQSSFEPVQGSPPAEPDPEIIKERLKWVQDFVPVLEQLKTLHPQAKRGLGIIQRLVKSVISNNNGLKQDSEKYKQEAVLKNNSLGKKDSDRKRKNRKIGDKYVDSDNETVDGKSDSEDEEPTPTLYQIAQRLSVLPQISAAPSRIRLKQIRQRQQQQQQQLQQQLYGQNIFPPPNIYGGTFGVDSPSGASIPSFQYHQPGTYPRAQYAAQRPPAQVPNHGNESNFQKHNGHPEHAHPPEPQQQALPTFVDNGSFSAQDLFSMMDTDNNLSYPVYQPQFSQPPFPIIPAPVQNGSSNGAPTPPSFPLDFVAAQSKPSIPFAQVPAGNLLENHVAGMEYSGLDPNAVTTPNSMVFTGTEFTNPAPSHPVQAPLSKPASSVDPQYQSHVSRPDYSNTGFVPAAHAVSDFASANYYKTLSIVNSNSITDEDYEIMCGLNSQDWTSSMIDFNQEFDFSLNTTTPPAECPDDVEPF